MAPQRSALLTIIARAASAMLVLTALLLVRSIAAIVLAERPAA